MRMKFRYCNSVFRLRFVVTKKKDFVGNKQQEVDNCSEKRFYIRIETFLGAQIHVALSDALCHSNSECINLLCMFKRGELWSEHAHGSMLVLFFSGFNEFERVHEYGRLNKTLSKY